MKPVFRYQVLDKDREDEASSRRTGYANAVSESSMLVEVAGDDENSRSGRQSASYPCNGCKVKPESLTKLNQNVML